MSNYSFIPPQIGYIPTGTYNGEPKPSTIFLGKNISGSAGSDGVGLGANGRPDYLSRVSICLATGNMPSDQISMINLDISDIYNLTQQNARIPKNITFKLTQVSVCGEIAGGQFAESGMMILASQAYPIS